MQLLDILIFVLLCFAGVHGYIRGFVRQIGSLTGLLLAIIGASYLCRYTETLLVGLFNWPDYVYHPLAWLLTFLVIYLSVWTLAWLLLRMVKFVRLGIIDRIGGILFNMFKYVLVMSVVINIFALLDRDSRMLSRKKKEHSYFYYPVKRVAPTLFSLVTEEVVNG
ncbi:MAG: CvpA family protein [Coprobacter sp.]|nr:CvpA family protein [Coprobacter sp.]